MFYTDFNMQEVFRPLDPRAFFASMKDFLQTKPDLFYVNKLLPLEMILLNRKYFLIHKL